MARVLARDPRDLAQHALRARRQVLEIADRVPQQRVYMVWPTPALYGASDAELDLAARVLTDGLSSRLPKALVYDAEKATNVNAFQFGTEIATCSAGLATARPAHAPTGS